MVLVAKSIKNRVKRYICYCQLSKFNKIENRDCEKDILIFPAWLKHQAFPFVENNQTRITAAGNVAIMNK